MSASASSSAVFCIIDDDVDGRGGDDDEAGGDDEDASTNPRSLLPFVGAVISNRSSGGARVQHTVCGRRRLVGLANDCGGCPFGLDCVVRVKRSGEKERESENEESAF